MESIRRIIDRHEQIKNYVHTRFRYPLPPAGRKMMGFVYFCIPVISGYYIMQWAISKSHDSIGRRGEYLPNQQDTESSLGGQHRIVVDDADGRTKLVRIGGAGGWGAGVNLADSDPVTQERNRKKLLKFLKQQRQKTMNNSGVDKDDSSIERE